MSTSATSELTAFFAVASRSALINADRPIADTTIPVGTALNAVTAIMENAFSSLAKVNLARLVVGFARLRLCTFQVDTLAFLATDHVLTT